MNEPYVKALTDPSTIDGYDESMIYESTNDLTEDKTYNPELISYALINLLESIKFYEEDCDPQKVFYTVMFADKTRNMCFDIQNIPHLLGLPSTKETLLNATAIEQVIRSCSQTLGLSFYNMLRQLKSQNMLSIFNDYLIPNQTAIEAHDSDPSKQAEAKLNWDKIARKVFSFLNIGVFSDQNANTTYYENTTRNKHTGEKITEYVLVRDLITEGINGQIRLRVILKKENKQEVLVPISLIFYPHNQNETKKSKLEMEGKIYKHRGELIITRQNSGQYGNKYGSAGTLKKTLKPNNAQTGGGNNGSV